MKTNLLISILFTSSLLTYIYRNRFITQINTYWNSRENKTIKKIDEDRNISFQQDKYSMNLYSNDKYFDDIIHYIYNRSPEKINDFIYNEETIYTYNDWKYRRENREHNKIKIIKPHECDFDFDYNDHKIYFNLSIIKDNNNNIIKLLESEDCSTYETILKKLTIKSDSKDTLINFIDESKTSIKKIYDKYKKKKKDTIRIFYYKKDYWSLLSKSPKRPINTIYLVKDQKEKMIQEIQSFFSEDMRNTYLSFGIPYKSVWMIHGPPGSGKTTTIKALASELDCDLFILPIMKDMHDTDFVNAFSYINDQDSNKRIIVIEDVDTFFDDRKEGDKNNGITLQGFLNCLDGFTCMEGTVLFLTANRPEVLDYAFIRSCRIDHKIELDYADKYQTKNMFHQFLPDQCDRFEEFYSLIQHKQYTTAVLQEFLFYNRKCENILELLDKFNEIYEKNEPKNFEILKEENKNFYS